MEYKCVACGCFFGDGEYSGASVIKCACPKCRGDLKRVE